MNIPSLKAQGNYGSNSVWTWYFQQTVVYLLAIMLSKIVLSCIVFMWSDLLRHISRWLFRQFGLADDLELVLALIVLPFFMSMVQVGPTTRNVDR